MMHRPRCQQGRDRHAVGADGTVGEDDQAVAVGDRLFRLVRNPVQRVFEDFFALTLRIGDIDHLRSPPAVVQFLELCGAGVVEDWLIEPQPMGVLGTVDQHVALGTDVGPEAHDHFLPNRVDRRIGDLGEELLEVVVDQPRAVGKHRQWRIVAHGTEGLLGVLGHRLEDQLQMLECEPERAHALEDRLCLQIVHLTRRRKVFQTDALFLEPCTERVPGGDSVLELLVPDDAPLVKVDEEHASRLQPPLVGNRFRIDRQDPHLAGHDDQVVVGEVVAAWPQTVSVQDGTDHMAIGEGDRGGTVPRFHLRTHELVHRLADVGHVAVVLPRLRHHHHHRLRQLPATLQQQLEDVVETPGVGEVRLDHRHDFFDVVTEEFALHDPLAGPHLVHIAAKGVDLTVVTHEPQRLRPVPAREGVGRESAVNHREMGVEERVRQIPVVPEELFRREHSLVDDVSRGKAANVEKVLRVGFTAPQRVGGDLADHVELPLEYIRIDAVAGGYERLADHRFRRQGAGANHAVVTGHVSPADKALSGIGGDPFNGGLAGGAFLIILRQKKQSRGEAPPGRQLRPEFLAGDTF